MAVGRKWFNIWNNSLAEIQQQAEMVQLWVEWSQKRDFSYANLAAAGGSFVELTLIETSLFINVIDIIDRQTSGTCSSRRCFTESPGRRLDVRRLLTRTQLLPLVKLL